MRKNKAIIFIGVILIIAMVMAFAVGCKPKNDNGGTTVDNNAGETVIQNSVDRGVNFVVIADGDVDDVESKIIVTNVYTNEVVNSPVVESNGKYRVYPPVGYYVIGQTYKISLTDKSLRFEGYGSNVKNIMFVVTKDALSKISMKDGLLVFDSKNVLSAPQDAYQIKDGEQQITGTMTLQTNGVDIKKGDIIIINNENTKLQEAYKVDNNYNIDSNTASLIQYSKPQMNEVYDEFEVSESKELSQDSDIEFTYDEIREAMDESDLATAALEVFGTKPQFGFNINKVAKEDGRLVINAVVTMTIPNVVKIEKALGADLVIKFNCMISVDADVNVSMAGEDVDCGVNAKVYNNVETTVEISTGYSIDKVENLTELIEKANQLEDAETGVAVPMFTWVLPVANGAIAVRYQCDLHLAFSFSGAIGVKIDTDFNYQLGANYTKANGVETVAKVLDGSGFKNVQLTIEGNAKVKLGLANTLAVDVLAGVVSLGIKAEVGNFNGVYGCAKTSNLLAPNPTISGAIYFEGGFYYDIDLLIALSIGKIANIDKKVDITDGEIVLYTAGERELITSIDDQEIVLTAVETLVPEFVAEAYDIKDGRAYQTTVKFDKSMEAGDNVVVENGVIRVVDPEKSVNSNLRFQYKNIIVNATVKFDRVVVFDKSVYAYDKAGDNRMDDVKIVLSGEAIDGSEEVVVEGATYDKASNTVTIPYKNVALMENGVNTVEVSVNGDVYHAYIAVSGSLDVLGFNVNGVYEIFAAEQIVDMTAKNDNFNGKTLKLVNDIDMDGAVIAPIKEFGGVLDGNGKTISGYTVEGVVNNAVALIAVNNGQIKDLTVDGKVNAVISAKTGNDYLVAGLVAQNNGVVKNVTVNGSVEMNSTSLNAFVTIRVMSIVGNGKRESASSTNVEIVAVSQFDVANVTIYVDYDVQHECYCKNAAVATGALVKFEKAEK